MKSFYIIANREKDENLRLSCDIADYLEKRGMRCRIRGAEVDVRAQIREAEAEGILVLGGDGTLLRAARELAGLEIPFLGINLGHLGYLAEIEEQNVHTALDQLMADNYIVEERMMLGGSVWADGKETGHDIALNDIVLNRQGNLKVVDYDIYVNGEYLYSSTADGIIVSTPTGSTGYSLSAGGPIVSPEASILVLTPICSHALNSRSIVFSGEEKIHIKIGEGRHGGMDQACATFDGDNCFQMQSGDYVEIQKAAEVTRIIKINQVSFLQVLREKLSRS